MNGKKYLFLIAVILLFLSIANSCKKKDSDDSAQYTVGQSYGGGIVFYVDGTGTHGLIASTTDQSNTCVWGCVGTAVAVAEDSTVGAGQANTTAIVNTCTTMGIAAKVCNDLVLGGFSDWYLPSKLELELMYEQKAAIGGFTQYGYWSSTEHGNGTAWVEYFNTGTKATTMKSDGCHVRAIRSF